MICQRDLGLLRPKVTNGIQKDRVTNLGATREPTGEIEKNESFYMEESRAQRRETAKNHPRQKESA